MVIPTRDRPELLERCLNALARQTLGPKQFEIIVVDDGEAREGPAAARNEGVRRARAEIVAFTDDDTLPHRDWLKNGLAALTGDIDVVSGPIRVEGAGSDDPQHDARNLERGEFAAGNCFCRKSVLEEVGGFDESFRMAWREDSDLEFRLLAAGARIIHAPDAVVSHPRGPAGWLERLRQQRKLMFDALLFRKHRKLYRERFSGRQPRSFYVIAGAFLLAMAAALAGALAPAFAALYIWHALTASFCLKGLKPGAPPAEVLSLAAIPLVAVFWRVTGAIRFRVALV